MNTRTINVNVTSSLMVGVKKETEEKTCTFLSRTNVNRAGEAKEIKISLSVMAKNNVKPNTGQC
jgi:hypothetical protein